MGALPNATYIGFTGTPIDRTAYGKGTFKVFGTDDPKGYLDKYSIRESVEDGTTVPLHYSLAPNDLRVDRETLEKEFLELAELEGVSDVEELNKVLERAVTLKNMLKNRDRVDKVARFVAEHFRTNVEPMGYKAFLVAVDREACVFYKQALDKYLPPEDSVVVISTGGKKDSERPPQGMAGRGGGEAHPQGVPQAGREAQDPDRHREAADRLRRPDPLLHVPRQADAGPRAACRRSPASIGPTRTTKAGASPPGSCSTSSASSRSWRRPWPSTPRTWRESSRGSTFSRSGSRN